MKSIDSANQKKARGDGVVGRGQPLGGRLTGSIERPIWFGWGTRMDWKCISVTVEPDIRDEGAEQAGQVGRARRHQRVISRA